MKKGIYCGRPLLIGVCLIGIIALNYHNMSAMYLNNKKARLKPTQSHLKESSMQSRLTTEVCEKIEEKVRAFIEDESIGGVTPIDIQLKAIEEDDFDKYLIHAQVLGVDQSENINLYDYYIIVENRNEDYFCTTPLGVKITQGKDNPIEHALAKSMMKIINGWDVSTPKHEKKVKEHLQQTHAYMTQEVFSFITRLMMDWMETARLFDGKLLNVYYLLEDPLYQKKLEQIENAKATIKEVEVYYLELTEVNIDEANNQAEVKLRGSIRIKEDERTYTTPITQYMILKKGENTFYIAEEKFTTGN